MVLSSKLPQFQNLDACPASRRAGCVFFAAKTAFPVDFWADGPRMSNRGQAPPPPTAARRTGPPPPPLRRPQCAPGGQCGGHEELARIDLSPVVLGRARALSRSWPCF